jgi:hypothetical protein
MNKNTNITIIPDSGKIPEHDSKSRKNAITRKYTPKTHVKCYTPTVGNTICDLITQGHAITSVCKRKDMPSVTEFYRWLVEYPEFGNNYRLARARKAHLLVEKVELQPLEALKEVRSMDVSDKRCNAIVQAHRLAVDTNLKVAGLYNREEYGDKPAQALPATIGVQVVFGKCVSQPREVQAETVNSLQLSEEKDVNKL